MYRSHTEGEESQRYIRRHEVNKSLRQASLRCVTYLDHNNAYLPAEFKIGPAFLNLE
jgi:hypothetical protein